MSLFLLQPCNHIQNNTASKNRTASCMFEQGKPFITSTRNIHINCSNIPSKPTSPHREGSSVSLVFHISDTASLLLLFQFVFIPFVLHCPNQATYLGPIGGFYIRIYGIFFFNGAIIFRNVNINNPSEIAYEDPISWENTTILTLYVYRHVHSGVALRAILAAPLSCDEFILVTGTTL